MVAVLNDGSAGHHRVQCFLKQPVILKKVTRWSDSLPWEKVSVASAKEIVLLKSTGDFE